MRKILYTIIFEADTPAGKVFDVALIITILFSVTLSMLDSVASINQSYGSLLNILDWIVVGIFTIEYLLRLYCADNATKYTGSFFGIIDLISILPTYIGLFLPGGQYLSSIRVLRVLRIFRILKLVQYVQEAQLLASALYRSRRKLVVFLCTVFTLVIILGSLMYVIEGEENGFTSIPRSIYWAVVTLTTVGYGDISPQTPLGQALASLVMILGYGIIAVPTGIVSVEISRGSEDEENK